MARIRSKRTGRYDSEFEANLYKARPRKKGVRYGYEADAIPYIIARTYFPDITIRLPSGHKIFVEAKGYFSPEDKVKMAAVKKCHPDYDIRMVFMRKSKRNISWCTRHGYPYAIGKIPKEWLSE